MKFVCDEGVDRPIVDALREAGHEVLYVAEMDPGIADEDVLDLAGREEAVLVTADKDFGELVFRQARVHHGVVLVRLHGLRPEDKGRVVVGAVLEHGGQLAHAFAVVEKGRMRIRKPPS